MELETFGPFPVSRERFEAVYKPAAERLGITTAVAHQPGDATIEASHLCSWEVGVTLTLPRGIFLSDFWNEVGGEQ